MSIQWISRDAVFAALDMCTVLEHYQIKAGRGSSFRIHCPFHEDNKPSCSINPGSKLFNCFACGEQGNVLDFIAALEELDPKAEFRAVLETAIDIIGHNPTPQRQGTSKRPRRSHNTEKTREAGLSPSADRAHSAHVVGSAHPVCRASDGSGANGYGEAIGASGERSTAESRNGKRKKSKPKSQANGNEDMSEQLEPNRILEGTAFPLKLERQHAYLQARGYAQSTLDEFGIGFEPRTNALMAGRICFPIHNSHGELVAYAGRFVPQGLGDDGEEKLIDAKGKEQPRYKLPSGFHKQLVLYNLHRVLDRFPDSDTIVLVEGFWSVLRLHSFTISRRGGSPTIEDCDNQQETTHTNGLPAALPTAALMGRSVSAAQIQLLKACGFRKIILMLDGDEEGRMATQDALQQLAPQFYVRDAHLPDGTKPDDVDEAFLEEIAIELEGSNDELHTVRSSGCSQADTLDGPSNVNAGDAGDQPTPFSSFGLSLTTSWKQ